MNEHREARLIEQFVTALRHNPHAAPPPELDADTAAVIRQLVASTPTPDNALRQRVWESARLRARIHPNGRPVRLSEDEIMSLIYPRPAHAASMSVLTLGAVVLFVSLFIAFLVLRPTPPNALQIAAQTDTTPTNTHTPTLSPMSALTPTPAPFEIMPAFATGEAVFATPYMTFVTAEPFFMQTVQIDAPPTNGTQLEGTLDSARQVVAYQFTAVSDGVIAVSLLTNDVSVVGLSFSVQRENGGGGGGGGGGGFASPLPVMVASNHFTVQTGDQVAILVQLVGGGRADYTLHLLALEHIPLALDQTAENRLNDFVPLASYQFEGSAGQIISAQVAGVDGFDTRLILTDTTGAPVAMDSDGGAGYDPELYRVTLPADGTYYLQVQPERTGTGGSFSLSLTSETLPSLDDGTQTVLFNSQAAPQLQFSAQAGETVRLVVRQPASADDYALRSFSAQVLQNGRLLATFERGSVMSIPGGQELIAGGVTVQETGTLIVVLDASTTLTEPSTQQFALEVAIER